MTHSPDHAERAKEVLTAWANSRGDARTNIIAAMLAYADERVAAALRGRDVVVEWEVWQDDMPVATSTDEADARHYLMVYGQDGPATLTRVERTEVARAALHDAAHLQQNGES